MEQKEMERMFYSLTNFYTDNLPMDAGLTKLIDIYGKTLSKFAWGQLEHIRDHSFIQSTRTLNTLPYFKLDIKEGSYSKERANALKKEKFERMIEIMNERNEYIRLHFSSFDSREPYVYTMNLKINFQSKDNLEIYRDYFIQNNCLYLLPDFVLQRQYTPRFLHAFDIKYDDKRLEKNWGTIFNLEAGPLLPRYQYKQILQSFHQVMHSNLTIKDIKQAIKTATGWETFNIQDKLSKDLSIGKKLMYDNWLISPLRFLVSVPEDIIRDKIRINILLSLLDEVKEEQTNYFVFYDIVRKEIWDKKGDTVYPTMLLNPNDAMKHIDTYAITHHEYPEIPRNFRVSLIDLNMITFECRTNTDGTTHFELFGATDEFGEYVFLEQIVNDPNVTKISFIHDANVSGKSYYKLRAVVDTTQQSMMTLPVSIA